MHARLAKEPLTIYVARGEDNACGPGCREWIAVQGQFDQGSAKRFDDIVDKANARHMPVFLNSTGGLADEGIALGRSLRARGMRAGVASTDRSCPRQPKGACKPVVGETADAVWRSDKAVCSSACVFALIGAVERWVPNDGKVGVHSTVYLCFAKNGQVTRPVGNSKDAIDCRKKIAVRVNQITSYIRDMGITGEFVDAMNKVPSTQIRFLTREEIARFGIDRGEFAKRPEKADAPEPARAVSSEPEKTAPPEPEPAVPPASTGTQTDDQ